jgi:hypothetical protein
MVSMIILPIRYRSVLDKLTNMGGAGGARTGTPAPVPRNAAPSRQARWLRRMCRWLLRQRESLTTGTGYARVAERGPLCL